MRFDSLIRSHVAFARNLSVAQRIGLLLAAALFVAAGVLHFTKTVFYLKIMPPYIPWHLSMVYVSGACEILGGLGLLFSVTRRAAAWGVVALLIAVFPANIKHAMENVPVAGVTLTWWYHAPRLALQPVLVWWALFCSGVVDWPSPAER